MPVTGEDGVPGPTLLMARTVQVYGVSLVSPLTTMGEAVDVPVPDGVQLAL